jgi:hypothetical protein
MRTLNARRWLGLSLLGASVSLLPFAACSPGGGAASGGATSGGNAATGGSTGGVGTGGAPLVTGGSPATGGVPATGGTPATGGITATGGALATGGTAGAASGGGSAGAGGGGTSVPLMMPIERAGKYVLEFGELRFEADPAIGGRVTALAFGGTNLFTGASVDAINHGSTFWPSPQSAWGWPPLVQVDSAAYTASVTGSTITLTGTASTMANAKVSVVKKFSPVLDQQAIDLEYTLKNEDTAAKSWAPWEISRVVPKGLIFWPTGSKVVTQAATDKSFNPANITVADGISWYKDMNVAADISAKYDAEGAEGWLAYVTSDLLYIKRFPNITEAQMAPGEGEVAFYIGADDAYIELEPQGAHESIAPGASISWKVRWYVRRLSDPSIATQGNAALVTMVRDIVAKP